VSFLPTRRRLLAGAALAVVYVLVVGVTLGVRGDHVRPLYEGIGPSNPYNWVNPPAVFKANNQKPHSATASVPMGPQGSTPTGIQTADAQVVLALGTGAVPPHGSDKSVTVTIKPLDPADLAPLPSHLYANGNAYRIEMVYEPSRTPIRTLPKPGSMTLTIPGIGHDLYTSTDGQRWSVVTAHNVPPTDLVLGAALSTTGYYLGATTLPQEPAGAAGTSSSNTTVKLAGGAGVLALVVVAATLVLVRRRRRRQQQVKQRRRDRQKQRDRRQKGGGPGRAR
jgi:hypothetical protein